MSSKMSKVTVLGLSPRQVRRLTMLDVHKPAMHAALTFVRGATVGAEKPYERGDITLRMLVEEGILSPGRMC